MHYVLDSSALLAVIYQEKGGDVVMPVLDKAIISSVNLCEVLSKLFLDGMNEMDVGQFLSSQAIHVVQPFDRLEAYAASEMVMATQKYGLSLGDRACLATAISFQGTGKVTVLTADKIWAKLDFGSRIRIKLIR